MEPLIAVAIIAISEAAVILYAWVGYRVAKILEPETGWIYLVGYVWGGLFYEIMEFLGGLVK